jgi:pilus assembly protein CpaD
MRLTFLLTLILVLACTALSGCEQTINHWREGDEQVLSGKNYPIKVTPSVSAVSLKLTPSRGLGESALEELNSLLMHQGRIRDQVILLQPYTDAGEQFAIKLRSTLLHAGAQQVRIQPASYRADQSQWDLRVQSQALVVNVPDCRIKDPEKWTIQPYEAVGPLGCANRANLARMVADPRDLIRAKPLDTGDGVAAVNAVKRYHEDDLKELLDIDFNEDN